MRTSLAVMAGVPGAFGLIPGVVLTGTISGYPASIYPNAVVPILSSLSHFRRARKNGAPQVVEWERSLWLPLESLLMPSPRCRAAMRPSRRRAACGRSLGLVVRHCSRHVEKDRLFGFRDRARPRWSELPTNVCTFIANQSWTVEACAQYPGDFSRCDPGLTENCYFLNCSGRWLMWAEYP
ncbi:MAG TPA: hypothetical protein VIJ34_07790 [Acidimicrobiales bacterium]